jgi:hypothetical protein
MATLEHHWKFNGNLQDAVGDAHFVDGTTLPTYTQNKDGVDDSALYPSVDFDMKAYVQTEGFEENESFSYSFWHKFDDVAAENESAVYWGRVIAANGPPILLSTGSGRYILYCHGRFLPAAGGHSNRRFTAVVEPVDTAYLQEWHFLTITMKRNTDTTITIKMYIDGILRGIENTPAGYAYDVQSYAPKIGVGQSYCRIDEFKFFNGALDDGGVGAVGQPAKPNSEIWLLYLDGVNNRPRYTLNEATNVTATTATVSWTK